MKKVALILSLLIQSSFALAQGRELELVLDNVYEASFEWDAYFHVTFPEQTQQQIQTCVSVKASQLEKTIWSAVENFRSHYPDEELPYREAKKQLKSYLGNETFWKCETIIDKTQYDVVVQIYLSASKKSIVQIEFERIK